MYKKIVIAGGNGFLGRSLTKYFRDKAKQIVIISRSPVPTAEKIKWAAWDGENLAAWVNELENADVLINLAGKNVDCRYTAKNKRQIFSSRLNSTQVLGEAIKKCSAAPTVWINASSATIYNASFDEMMTESNGKIGDDFSMTVCKRWEEMFNAFAGIPTRQVIMRISIVLGWDGAALPALANLVKFGLGGYQADGKQFCSWIHVDDFCRAVEWLIANESASGPYNVTAPTPLPNRQFMTTLRTAMKKSYGLPSPRWLLELGSFVIRTETELVLKSRKVYPERLLKDGFRFHYENLEAAMKNLATAKR